MISLSIVKAEVLETAIKKEGTNKQCNTQISDIEAAILSDLY
jgi:hypothetical protein